MTTAATAVFGAAAVLLVPGIALADGWQLVEPMPVPRTYHTAATVGDQWYVAAGDTLSDGERFPSEIDAYDPTAGRWRVVGRLSQERKNVVSIADPFRPRALLTGGFLPAGPDGYLVLANCELVSGDGISPAPALSGPRSLHAGAFAAGKLVVSGGGGMDQTGSKLLDDAEVWDGTADAWMSAGKMPGGARSCHSMTTLADGRRILTIGGWGPLAVLREAALFDATTSTWTVATAPNVGRCAHTAILLRDGRVLVAGGTTGSTIAPDASAEVYDPATEQWTLVAPMHDPRYDHRMVDLPDGRILVAGGSNSPTRGEYGALASAEVYDPVADQWTMLPPMRDRRRTPALAVLSDGVYVAGGSYSDSPGPLTAVALASVERLSWADLGITGPNVDAGVRDATGGDAGDHDADRDAGLDAADTDAASSDGAVNPTDAAASDGKSGQQGDGCSCATERPRTDWLPFGSAAALLVAHLAGSRRGRNRRPPPAATSERV